MLKLKTVKECPYTRKAKGVVRMTPELIGELAAAVHDKDEWAIVLTGERSDGGYQVDVTGYFMPPQERSSGHVSVAEIDTLDTEVPLNIVGVVHSHHSLGAFFSSVDTSTLNPRFPVSIVVAIEKKQYLGFEYKGEGKVMLSCGATARIPFEIQPTVGPVVAEVNKVAHKPDDLGGCISYSDQASTPYQIKYVAACGLEEPEVLKADAFPKVETLNELVKQLPRPQLSKSQWDKSGSQPIGAEVAKGAVNNSWINCRKCKASIAAKRDTTGLWIWCSKCLVRTELLSAKKPEVSETQAGWLASLIPDRWKPTTKCAYHFFVEGKCKSCGLEADSLIRPLERDAEETFHEIVDEVKPTIFSKQDDACLHEDIYAGWCVDCNVMIGAQTPFGALDLIECTVCGDMNDFRHFECTNCHDSVLCDVCDVGHKADECPLEIEVN